MTSITKTILICTLSIGVLISFNNCSKLASYNKAQNKEEISIILKNKYNKIEKSTITVININGNLIYDGDIMLGHKSELTKDKELYWNLTPQEARTNNLKTNQSLASTVTPLWPEGIVPYMYDNELTGSEFVDFKRFFEEKVLEFNRVMAGNNIKITFKERTNESKYLIVGDISKHNVISPCFATVGRAYGQLRLNLGAPCRDRRIPFHEMLHVLGINHEHRRHDRDKYIEIFPENMIDGLYAAAFDKVLESVTVDSGEFDYDSIMLYNSYAGSKNGSPIILRREAGRNNNKDIINSQHLSPGDIQGLRILYGPIKEELTENEANTSEIIFCSSENFDPDGDGFGWENEASCVVKNGTGDNNLQNLKYCKSAASDPDGDGFGWENETSCVVKNGIGDNNLQPPKYCKSATSDPDGDGFGWEDGASCVVKTLENR